MRVLIAIATQWGHAPEDTHPTPGAPVPARILPVGTPPGGAVSSGAFRRHR